jgi:gamma-glutamylaminecyclotransferase
MVVAGPRYVPMMLDQPGDGRQVIGELYEVDDRTVRRLDALESVDRPGQFRAVLLVERLGGGPAMPAYVYMKSPRLARPRHSGDLAAYHRDRRFIPPARHRPPGKRPASQSSWDGAGAQERTRTSTACTTGT